MSGTRFALDTEKIDDRLKYVEWIREASVSGKSLVNIVFDIARLSWGEGRLRASEYFLYQLYDDKRFPPEAKRTFLGIDRVGQLLSTLEMPWPELAKDKPTITALLRGYDLPIPETQAIRHNDRSFPGAKTLHNANDVKRFLREEASYPIFTKPTNSRCSLGVANLERYDRTKDCVITKHGRSVPVGEFTEQVEQFAQGGYLFQTRLEPHAKIAELVGDQLSTVRMFVLVDDGGATLLRASWKIPSGESVADNFWRSGNMLGGIDVDTGRVIRVLRRMNDRTVAVDRHPKAGTAFTDLLFPEWVQMRDIVMRAAAAFPTCHFQGWDVALTDRGPVLVELEGDGGDPIMEQLCFNSGLLEGRYLKFAKKALEKQKEKKKLERDVKRQRQWANFTQLKASEPTPTMHTSNQN
jgi:hypothetical protein